MQQLLCRTGIVLDLANSNEIHSPTTKVVLIDRGHADFCIVTVTATNNASVSTLPLKQLYPKIYLIMLTRMRLVL